MSDLEPSRYGKGHFARNGKPCIYTDGYILVFCGAESLIAVRALLSWDSLSASPLVPVNDPKALPLPRTASLPNAIIGLRDPVEHERPVTLCMPPDSICVFELTEAYERTSQELREKIRKIEASKLGARAKTNRIAPITTTLAQAERAHKDKHSAGYFGIRLGPSTVDGRLLDRALRWLGATQGTLRAHRDEYSQLVLYTDKGIAVIMPLRTS